MPLTIQQINEVMNNTISIWHQRSDINGGSLTRKAIVREIPEINDGEAILIYRQRNNPSEEFVYLPLNNNMTIQRYTDTRPFINISGGIQPYKMPEKHLSDEDISFMSRYLSSK